MANFSKAIDRVSNPVYMGSKQEIIEYYKDTAGANWKRAAATQLAGTSDTKSREYKSAMRNFQGSRLQSDSKSPKWSGLAEKLPPVSRTPKSPTITVTVEGKQYRPGREPRIRKIDRQMTGEQAYSFVNKPTWHKLWLGYGHNFSEAEDEYGLYDVVIT